MGNCVNYEMPQSQEKRWTPDSEEEVKSIEERRSAATTPTRIEVPEEDSSPNGYPSNEDRPGRKVLQKSTNNGSEDPKTSDDPPIEEPPVINDLKKFTNGPEDPRETSDDPPIEEPPVINDLKKSTNGLEDPKETSDDPPFEEPPVIDDLKKSTNGPEDPKETSDCDPPIEEPPEIKRCMNLPKEKDGTKGTTSVCRMDIDQPSDSDSMSSQASREVEPLTLEENPSKTRTSSSTFKKFTVLSLYLPGLWIGSIVMNQRSEVQDIQSFLMIREKQPSADQCTGKACQFRNWVNAHNSLCSLDRNGTVVDVKHTFCPSYSSNSTWASAPECNFAAWLDSQNRIEECSLNVDKRVSEIWSKYAPFRLVRNSASPVDKIENSMHEEGDENEGQLDWMLDSLRSFKLGNLN